MDECELITFISAIACTISKCYSEEELELLSALFTQLGDSLATILVRRDFCNKQTSMNTNNETNDYE
ncbi:MAG: DUF6774 domain-containing protein [Lachnotalea sp.]